jgi:membrane protein implicated in regulation of membrane protease activity
VLLCFELAFIDAQFYLVFVGAAALAVGFLALAGLLPADWLQWSAFGLLSLFFVVVFRRRIYASLRRELPDLRQGPVGESVVLPSELQPGASCRLEYCGSSWTATNGGESRILAGQRARIERVNGLTLIIQGEIP